MRARSRVPSRTPTTRASYSSRTVRSRAPTWWPMANLANLERVSKAYGVRPLLSEVSLGVAASERIGIVGRNGDGKTTLLQVLTGQEPPDEGRVSAARGLHVGYLHQGDTLD